MPTPSDRRLRNALRIALSHYVANGMSAALGLLLISAAVQIAFGPFAAAAASVGAIVAIPSDQPAPKRGKFWQLLPAALIGPPLFLAVQMVHARPAQLAALLVPASFMAFLGAAWGKRGLPISISVMFAMIFSMALTAQPARADTAWSASAFFALGAFAYVVWATLANALLNARYRVQMLADALLAVGALMRTQARRFSAPGEGDGTDAAPLLGRLLRDQSALSDQLQSARDIVLESPRTPRRQQLAGMLVQLLEMRDHLVACELDLEAVRAQPGQAGVLAALRAEIESLAERIDALADALLLGRVPAPFDAPRAMPAVLAAAGPAHSSSDDSPMPDGAGPPSGDPDREPAAPSPDVLARGLVSRIGHLHDETQRLTALARGDAQPDLAIVRAAWQMFVSPTEWSWRPLAGLWRWDAPPLRHAIRAALAIATGQAVAVALPWGTHDYWILLTIVVVLRGSLAQTLERRNHRIAGTLLGCVLAGALLYLRVPPLLLVVAVTLAQGVAHAFAVRRYLVTAVAATILALLQAHLLNAGASPAFEAVERIADTLIGVAIAWAFSYVLPSWERRQIPALVARTLAAQARHARVALGLGQLDAVTNEAELHWRLARREVYDSLSALVQATQRSLAEPRAVRPPLEALERLIAHSYQLLAQLTAVKTMLLLRRGRLDAAQIRAPLLEAAQRIEARLSDHGDASSTPPHAASDADESVGVATLSDPFERDLTPWLLRRLHLAGGLALRVSAEARQVLGPPRKGDGGQRVPS
jgi:uncharacterized membrane protein YccC